MAIANFRSKLNFEPKQIQFIDNVYTLKTDHKTGLLREEPDDMSRMVFSWSAQSFQSHSTQAPATSSSYRQKH